MLDDEDSKDEMSIVEWLSRMNLNKYVDLFKKRKIFFLSDLRHFVDDCSKEFEITEFNDATRIDNVLKEDKLMKEDFKYLSKNKCRQIIRKIVSNNELLE